MSIENIINSYFTGTMISEHLKDALIKHSEEKQQKIDQLEREVETANEMLEIEQSNSDNLLSKVSKLERDVESNKAQYNSTLAMLKDENQQLKERNKELSDRINKYGQHQHSRGEMLKDIVTWEDWKQD